MNQYKYFGNRGTKERLNNISILYVIMFLFAIIGKIVKGNKGMFYSSLLSGLSFLLFKILKNN